MGRIADLLAGQLSRPHGRVAGAVAAALNVGNRKHNAAAVEALAPTADDRILEVGFGGGIGLRFVLATPARSVTGLEISPEMVARARRVFSREIGHGRLRVEEGAVDDLPFPDGSFDGALSVNCIYFWADPIRGLEEIRRVLTDDGRCVLGVDPRSHQYFDRYPGFQGFTADEAETAALKAGFADVRTEEVRRNLWIVVARCR